MQSTGDFHTLSLSCLLNSFIERRNDEKKPRRIAALRGIEITQISTGGWHCLALDSAGLVYAWGGNEYGQCHVEWAVRLQACTISTTEPDASHLTPAVLISQECQNHAPAACTEVVLLPKLWHFSEEKHHVCDCVEA